MKVLHLTDEEFNVLGITSIGDRVRLREQCRQILKGKQNFKLSIYYIVFLHLKNFN